MRSPTRISILSILFVLIFAGCSQRTPEPTPSVSPQAEPTLTSQRTAAPTEEPAAEDPIYLAIIWHQHQPVYFKNPDTNIYIRPWVRVHATKDYVDMAAILGKYPDVRVTFNLTPSLIRQLDDLQAGAKDEYWVHAEVPAEQLTETQKQFIMDRFWDINTRIIERFPRYLSLRAKRNQSQDPVSAFSTQDFRDLQVLFNLAWTDPDFLAEEPLKSLVEKGQDFEEADKTILFAEHQRLIQAVIPIHRQLQEAGQIEVTMTPFAHPILPLLITSDLAARALPDLALPSPSFVFGQDAVAQVERGVELYSDHFGMAPRGMWPAEGSVAQEIVTMVSSSDIQWMASDEGVLANSLGFDSFTRDAKEVVVQADELYRPYYVQGSRGAPVAIVFRDVLISDKVGFTYSGMAGELAAQDFVERIHAIRDKLIADGRQGPHLVSVILDGENAWEHYENDGKEFLHGLYRRLSEDPTIITVTPSEFLAIAPEQPQIENLWAGSWINHDFSTWIGEEEENAAWALLAETRAFLQDFITGRRADDVSEETLDEALTQMYIAEGSDWFWWYGADQNSGNDTNFDLQYRETLKQIYSTLGEDPPRALDVPIIPEEPATADRPSIGLITPILDGLPGEGEWDAAGLYRAGGGAMAPGQRSLDEFLYGFDSANLYIGVGGRDGFTSPTDGSLEFYLRVPGSGETNSFTKSGSLLGFSANRLLRLAFGEGDSKAIEVYEAAGDGEWTPRTTSDALAMSSGFLEFGVPLQDLGNADTGDRVFLRAFFTEKLGAASVDLMQIPAAGPALVNVPELGTTILILDIQDPEGDDHGPGTYTYPRDAVFRGGAYDILNFQVGFDAENLVFKFIIRGPVENVWDSPNGLSIQTFDVYIDADGDGSGGVAMLPGRNLALQSGFAWDFAVTAEGWTAGVFTPGDEGPVRIAESSEFIILTDPAQRKVTLRVPKVILGESPENWAYAAVVLSQEGFPSGGVLRVRDVLPQPEQWRIGGAPPGATNHTRVMDWVWPTPNDQELYLSDYTPSTKSQSALLPADFAAVPMLLVDQP